MGVTILKKVSGSNLVESAQATVNAHEKAPYWNISILDSAQIVSASPQLLDLIGVTEEERRHILDWILNARNQQHGYWGNITSPHSALVDTLAVVEMLLKVNKDGQYTALIIDSLAAISFLLEVSPPNITEYHEPVGFELNVPSMMYSIAELLLEQHFFSDESAKWQQLDKNEVGAKHQLRRGVLARFLSDSAQKYFFDTVVEDGNAKIELVRNMLGKLTGNDVTTKFTVGALARLQQQGRLTEPELTQILSINKVLSPNGAMCLAELEASINGDVAKELINYLRTTLNAHDRKGFPNLYPILNTSLLWQLLTKMFSGGIDQFSPQLLDQLEEFYRSQAYQKRSGEWVVGRIGWDPLDVDKAGQALIPDLDDTVVMLGVYLILNYHRGEKASGQQPLPKFDFDSLAYFFDPRFDRWRCYPEEATTTASHILQLFMVLQLTQQYGPQYLLNHSQLKRYYLAAKKQVRRLAYSPDYLRADKWIISKYYNPFRIFSLPELVEESPVMVAMLAGEVIEEQNDDGGFSTGNLPSNLEETTYALYGIYNLWEAITNDNIRNPMIGKLLPGLEKVMIRGSRFLSEQLQLPTSEIIDEAPELWLSQNLYKPLFIILGLANDANALVDKIVKDDSLKGDSAGGENNIDSNSPAKQFVTDESIQQSIMQSADVMWWLSRNMLGRDAGYQRMAVELSGQMGVAINIKEAFLTIINNTGGDFQIINKLLELFGGYGPAELQQLIDKLSDLGITDQRLAGMISEAQKVDKAENILNSNWNKPDYPIDDLKTVAGLIARLRALDEGSTAEMGKLLEAVIHALDNLLTLVAAVTLKSYRNVPADYQMEWISGWQEHMEMQNQQELRKNAVDDRKIFMKTSSEEDRQIPTLKQVADKFMQEFAATGALGPAIWGALPFSNHFDDEQFRRFFQFNSPHMQFLMGVYRFVQDIDVDPTERINLGVAWLSAQHQIMIGEAKQRLQNHETRVELITELEAYWEKYILPEIDRMIDYYDDVPSIQHFLKVSKKIFVGIRTLKSYTKTKTL